MFGVRNSYSLSSFFGQFSVHARYVFKILKREGVFLVLVEKKKRVTRRRNGKESGG